MNLYVFIVSDVIKILSYWKSSHGTLIHGFIEVYPLFNIPFQDKMFPWLKLKKT